MQIDDVPPPLEARLGPAATNGLLQLLDHSRREVREDVIAACTDRFECRLTEEVSHLRVQISEAESRLRGDIAAGRVEFIKWSFLFWVGQVIAVTGVFSILLRVMR